MNTRLFILMLLVCLVALLQGLAGIDVAPDGLPDSWFDGR